MASSASNLQFASLVVHEAKVHDVIYDEDFKKLWDKGISIFDGFRNETFDLRAMLFCTINDFLAYRNLSMYNVKDHRACPICEEDTSYIQLKHGRKIVYIRHRRFLQPHHLYRRLKKAFNGNQ